MSGIESITRDGIAGRLLWAEPDPNTRFRYTIWFDYHRQLFNELKEGDLLIVPNFATKSEDIHYSILQIISIFPLHYAIGKNNSDAFPGYMMEAAKSASVDWTEQENESYEHTTKIICDAIPTNLECDVEGNLNNELSMAMVGKDAYALNSNMTNAIFNNGINESMGDIITAGLLIRDNAVHIDVLIEEFLRTHFGIFGFTGVGKSNLVSTLINKLFSSSTTVKIILFDLMDEYTGLLMDEIADKGKVICLGRKTLLGPVFEYLDNNFDDSLRKDAVDTFTESLLLPKGLKTEEIMEEVKGKAPDIIKNIRIWEKWWLVKDFVNVYKTEAKSSKLKGETSVGIDKAYEAIFGQIMNKYLNPSLARFLLEKFFDPNKKEYVKGINTTVQDRIDRVKAELEEISKLDDLKPEIKISIREIIEDLEDESKSSLYIITSHDPVLMREFSKALGNGVFENRRSNGRFNPLVSFIFDEADEFMPNDKYAGENPAQMYEKSRKIIETLARRGRKFGLGVGIATQRSSYLDTKTIGQLHTYLISKLPRQADREAVSGAFGLAEDQLKQTFKFLKGEWLIVSHDATGIDMPIPITTENAEERIKNYLIVDNEA